MSKNTSKAAAYIQKEIDRLEKEYETWQIKASIANENIRNTGIRIDELREQLEKLEPKTAFASL